MSLADPPIPSELEHALGVVVADIRAAAGDNVLGVALYGGLAKGRYTPGVSDVNLLIVVRDAALADLEALAPALTGARRAYRVSSFVATPADLRATARLFPVKYADLQAAHRVLHGDVGLGGVAADRAALRVRAEQELRNIELRVRQRAVERGADPVVLWRAVLRTLPKLAVTLEVVLRLAGRTPPGDRAGVLVAGVEVLGVEPQRVTRLSGLHRGDAQPDDATARALAADYLTLLADLAGAVERRFPE